MEPYTDIFGPKNALVIPKQGVANAWQLTSEAMRQNKAAIVIQNWKLGRSLALWLGLGSKLIDCTLLLAAGSVISALAPKEACHICCKPLAFASLAAHVAYCIGWLAQPWGRYRMAYGPGLWTVLMNPEKNQDENVLLVRQPEMEIPWFSSLASLGSIAFAFRNQLNKEDITKLLNDLKDKASKKFEHKKEKE